MFFFKPRQLTIGIFLSLIFIFGHGKQHFLPKNLKGPSVTMSVSESHIAISNSGVTAKCAVTRSRGEQTSSEILL